jgi:hypothetical protein
MLPPVATTAAEDTAARSGRFNFFLFFLLPFFIYFF